MAIDDPGNQNRATGADSKFVGFLVNAGVQFIGQRDQYLAFSQQFRVEPLAHHLHCLVIAVDQCHGSNWARGRYRFVE